MFLNDLLIMINDCENNIKKIDIEIMGAMCHPVAMTFFDSKTDPISCFSRHDKNKLEAILNNPYQTFNQKDLYPTFNKKVAILYYGLIKGHCFENGNKRIATATLFSFLYINNFWIKDGINGTKDYLVDLALRLASSEGNNKMDDFLLEIEKWLDDNRITMLAR